LKKRSKQSGIASQLKQIKRTRFITSIAIAFIAALIISLIFSTGMYSNIQLRLSDFLYGGGQPLNNLAIIAVDDKSLQEIGRWPWERGNYTELIDYLEQSEVIGFDIAFFEESDPDVDAMLAEAIARHGKVVVPAEYTAFELSNGVLVGKDLVEPIDVVKEAAVDTGYINVITDKDGITRAVNLDIGGEYPPFASVVLQQYLKKPVPKESRFLINYIGRPGTYTYYSFSDVIDGKYEKEEFKDKIILVGATAPDLHDSYFVPISYGRAMPGVEIHANIVQQLVTGRTIKIAPFWLTVFLIFLAAVIIALMDFYLPMWLSTILAGVSMVVYIFIAIFAFNFGVIMNLIYIPFSVVASYLGTILYFYMSEKKSRKQVLGAFEKYVSKDVIKHIMENPEKLNLGGDKRVITVFFSDIRGFTTISEKLTPEKLVALLNEYLTEMTNIILKYNGVVDKYIGDAVMAFWNAPLDQPLHAERACLTSLEMQERLKELRKKWTSEGYPPVHIGIGLNTGPAVMGNMGSYDRFDYTAMGDTINLGSRLEGTTKAYGVGILISESTKKKIEKKPFVVRKIDMVKVKGKNKPITIYELMSRKKDAKKSDYLVIEHFEKGLSLYFKRKWNDALSEFRKADKVHKSGDKTSKIFIDRCKYFKKHDPGKAWDGVWVMTTK
jgi:adenylate cyclase